LDTHKPKGSFLNPLCHCFVSNRNVGAAEVGL
jgi:hypothetical protein